MAIVGTVGTGSALSPSQLETEPPLFVISVAETAYPYRVDAANYLIGSDTVSSVTSNLFYSAGSGGKLGSAWQTSITTSGTQITVLVNASQLQLGQTYFIITTFTANINKVCTFVSKLQVVA